MDNLFQPKSLPYRIYFNLELERSYEHSKTRNKKQETRKYKKI